MHCFLFVVIFHVFMSHLFILRFFRSQSVAVLRAESRRSDESGLACESVNLKKKKPSKTIGKLNKYCATDLNLFVG